MRYKQIAVIGAVLIATLVLLAAFMYYFNQGISNCPKGTFPCKNSTKCITHRNMCNNIKDCPGGEDENDCFDSYNNFWESLFPKWTTCSNASDNETQDHNNCKYFNCTVICEKFMGQKIPQIFAKKNVLTMTFRTSSLPILESDFFRDYPNLRNELYLMGNQIQYLEHGVFSNQKHLLWLGLSDNKIEKLSEGHLMGLNSLETLVVENNKIHTLDLRDFENSASLQVLELSRNLLTSSNLSIPHLPALQELNLNDNHLESITADIFAGLPALEELNLEYNLIRNISALAFQNLHRLTVLNLMNNRITRIPQGLFDPVPSLSSLWIGYNPIQILEASTFFSLKANLTSLNVEDIDLEDGKKDFFNTFTRLKHVYFKKFHYCTSYAPQVKICHPASDGVSSLHHLLSTPLLRAAVWGISCATCLGNALVLWGRFTAKDENRVLSIVIRNLAVSDLLMGLYLFIIGLQDIRFRDNYNLEASTWMSSWPCTFIGMLAMISSEVSVLILSFMSVERFMLIVTPLKGHRAVTPQTAAFSMIVIWLIGIILALIPAIHWRSSTRFYGLNGMCFPLHIDDPFIVGWEYSAFIFLGVNLLGLVTIVYVYIGMFMSIWYTRHGTPLSVGDSEFALRFFFIVLTDIVCWAPIIVLKIMALAEYPVAPELHAWVVVFILPVNSAVNPLLYTFTTPKFRERLSEGWFGKVRNIVSRKQSNSGSQISNSYYNKSMSTIPTNTKLFSQDTLPKPSLNETLLINICTKDD